MLMIKKAFAALLLFLFVFIACQDGFISPEEKGQGVDRTEDTDPTGISVTFDPNGGVWPDSSTIVALSLQSDQSPNFPKINPVRENHVFIGWTPEQKAPLSVNATLPDFNELFNSDTQISAPTTVYALWIEQPPNSRAILFITSLENETPEKICAVRFAYESNGYRLLNTLPSAGTRRHYSDNGKWYLSHGGEQEFTQLTEVKKPILKVYTRWNPNVYVVRFYENSHAQPVDRTYPYSGQDILFPAADFPPDPNPPASDTLNGGYTFAGWFFDENVVLNPMGSVQEGQNLSSGYTIDRNISAYAGWRRSNIILSFQTYNGNDITPIYRAATANGSSYKLIGTAPNVGSRPNYISDEQWYLDENAGTTFNPENIPIVFLASSSEIHSNWLPVEMGKKVLFFLDFNNSVKFTSRLAKLNEATGVGYALMGGMPAIPARPGFTSDGKWYYLRYGASPLERALTHNTNIETDSSYIYVFGRWTENGPAVMQKYNVAFYFQKDIVHLNIPVPANYTLSFDPDSTYSAEIEYAFLNDTSPLGWVHIPPDRLHAYTFYQGKFLTMTTQQWNECVANDLVFADRVIANKNMYIYRAWLNLGS